MKKEFLDNLDNNWSDMISNVYKEQNINTNILIKYDLNKFGLDEFMDNDVYYSIVDYYEENNQPLEDEDEALLIIKLKDEASLKECFYNDGTQITFSPSIYDIEVLINNFDITQYIIETLQSDLVLDDLSDLDFLSFGFLLTDKLFTFSGIEFSIGTEFGEIYFSEDYPTDQTEFMDCVILLNLNIFKQYMDQTSIKGIYDIAKIALPNAAIN